MRIGQTSFVYFLSEVGSSVVGFLATLYLTRNVAESVLGTYFLAVAVLIWITVLLGGTVQTAITKRLSETGDMGYVSAGGAILAGLFALSSVGMLLARRFFNEYIGAEVTVVLIGLLAAGLALSFVSGVLKGGHEVHVAALLRPLDRGIRGVLQVLAAAMGLGVIGLLAGYGIAAFVSAFAGAVYLSFHVTWPSRQHFRELFKFIKYSWLGRASSRAFTSMDTLVLGVFVAPSLIAYYEIAWNLASLLAIFGVAVAESVFPELSRLSEEGDVTQIGSLLEDAIAYSGLFLIPGLIGSYLIGARVLRIYEPAYATASTILVILVGSRLVYAYQSQFATALDGINRPDLTFRVNAVFFGGNLGLNVLLVWQFGWIGAAVATALSTAASLGLAYRYLTSLVVVSLPILELVRQVIATAAMAISVTVAGSTLGTGVPATIGLVGLGGVVYLVALFGISPRFRDTVIQNLPVRPLK